MPLAPARGATVHRWSRCPWVSSAATGFRRCRAHSSAIPGRASWPGSTTSASEPGAVATSQQLVWKLPAGKPVTSMGACYRNHSRRQVPMSLDSGPHTDLGRTGMSKRTRQRELARLRARRDAERQRVRRRRALLSYGGLAVVVAVTAVLGGLWLNRDEPASTAAATSTTPSTTTPPNDARADAPTAPAMANGGPNSGGSQFFISTADNSKGLQADYSVFGQVVDGQAVVDKIAAVPVGGQSGDTPAEAVWIQKLTVKVS